MNETKRFPYPTVGEQVSTIQQYKLETLLYCPHPWALRHRFINQETGEVVRVKCGRWDCLYCGPRKVDQWRQLVKAAGPTLFLTLTKAGKTVEEAARALTTFMQALRRGSKGKGKGRVDARQAYPVEYFAVLERHKDFEENGFHWHLLLHGVDRIPYKEVIQPLWRSATHGKAEIGFIEAIRKPAAIGYVTKYLTKDITRDERGYRAVEYTRSEVVLDAQEGDQAYVYVVRVDEDGRAVEQQETVTIQAVSHAHRIRYSRGFFPERVAALRVKLFTRLEEEIPLPEHCELVEVSESTVDVEEANNKPLDPDCGDNDGNGKPLNDEKGEDSAIPIKKPSSWRLIERDDFTNDPNQYQRWRSEALIEAVNDLRAGMRKYSRRIITTWHYQRNEYNRSRSLV